jgi:membrane fusion protein, copper/silver efflux system
MIHQFTRPASIVAGAGLLLVIAGAGLLVEYLRGAWPFATPAAEASDASPPAHDAHAQHGGAGSAHLPKGYGPVMIDPTRAEVLGLAAAPIEERDFTKVVRTVGVVALDETRTAHVHAKVRGWIHGIHVNFVGMKVNAGDPLCSIYSQEVYGAELEYLSMFDRAAGKGGDPLRESGRRRLELWDVPKAEIARLESSRQPKQTFAILAPRSGVVVSKEAIEGTYVDPSLELYTLSDLSRVWVIVDLYEADAPFAHLGDPARLSIEGETSPRDAKIVFLAPTIDEMTRTLKARFEIDNTDGRIRPGAFVTVEMKFSLGRGLAIPENAVIRTGARSIVFVSHGGDEGVHLEPREVVLGALAGDQYRVLEGLSSGDQVAIGAQFLLDSESRLKASSASGGGHVHAH